MTTFSEKAVSLVGRLNDAVENNAVDERQFRREAKKLHTENALEGDIVLSLLALAEGDVTTASMILSTYAAGGSDQASYILASICANAGLENRARTFYDNIRDKNFDGQDALAHCLDMIAVRHRKKEKNAIETVLKSFEEERKIWESLAKR